MYFYALIFWHHFCEREIVRKTNLHLGIDPKPGGCAMKSTLKLILIVPVILVFSALPVVHAQTSTATLENPKEVFCNDSPVLGEIYSPAQDPAQVDYYKISVLSGQRLIIDVDAETIGSTLDAFLEVLEPDGTPVDANNDQTNDPNDLTDDSLDPYLEIEASSDDVIYIIAISSGSSDPTNTDVIKKMEACTAKAIVASGAEASVITQLLEKFYLTQTVETILAQENTDGTNLSALDNQAIMEFTDESGNIIRKKVMVNIEVRIKENGGGQ